MIRAREFILAKGGLSAAGSYTKVMLAITGHYPWGNAPYLPVEMVLLPTWAPINFFDFNGYARVHVAPISICASKNYAHKLPGDADLSDLFPSSSKQVPSFKPPRSLLKAIEKHIKKYRCRLTKFVIWLSKNWNGLCWPDWNGTGPFIVILPPPCQ